MKPIVVVGSINMDLVSRAPRIPHAGETVLGSEFQLHSGGKGANQAVAAARLGHPAILLGATGDDIFGRQLRQTLSGYGVDVSHLATSPGPSGCASIVVDQAGENAIIVTPGANETVTVDYLRGKMDVLRSAGIVLAQLEIPLATVEWLGQTCSDLGVQFMLDPAPAQALPDTLLGQVTWFTPNETEASFYAAAGEDGDQMIARLFNLGTQNVILKRSSEGAVIACSEGSRYLCKSFSVDAVDTTAAGDAYNGAFAVALMQGQGSGEAARFAAAAAAVSVTRPGAQPSLATLDETLAMLAGRDALLNVD